MSFAFVCLFPYEQARAGAGQVRALSFEIKNSRFEFWASSFELQASSFKIRDSSFEIWASRSEIRASSFGLWDPSFELQAFFSEKGIELKLWNKIKLRSFWPKNNLKPLPNWHWVESFELGKITACYWSNYLRVRVSILGFWAQA